MQRKTSGWFINLTVKLASNDCVGKKVQGKQGDKQHALTLASFYHPCTKTSKDKVYLRFLETLNTLLGRSPSKSEIILGADINSNIGTLNRLHSAEFCTTLGPHGLPKWNKKGKNHLHIYLAHCLRIMNTFFKAKLGSSGHSTWMSNSPTSSGIPDTHMLNLLVCSASLHMHIRNCSTIT